MTNQLQQLIQQTVNLLPPEQWLGFPILVAVSGGPDSVALLRILVAIRDQNRATLTPLIVAHVNHRMRGSESDDDERFVCQLAEQLGLDSLVERAGAVPQDTSEENLRNFRYRSLEKIAREVGARYIATGHTLDDQVETILFRILRGTGLAGLTGIPPIRVVAESISIVRPLLEIPRIQIELLLHELNQDFRVDTSNADSRYTRNFLRHKLLPDLRNRFGDSVDHAIGRLGRQAAETETYLENQAKRLACSVRSRKANVAEFDLNDLRAQPKILRRQFFKLLWQEQQWPLQAMSFEWWQSLAEAVDAEMDSKVLNLPGGIRAEISQSTITLAQIDR